MTTEEYFDKIRDLIVGKKIKQTTTVEMTATDGFGRRVNGDALILEDGTLLNLYMSESDCCARAYGEWDIPNLEAGITDIQFHVSQDREPDEYDDGSHESRATITILHNQNSVTTASCYADDGNGGYYFSVLNLEIRLPSGEYEDEIILSA